MKRKEMAKMTEHSPKFELVKGYYDCVPYCLFLPAAAIVVAFYKFKFW